MKLKDNQEYLIKPSSLIYVYKTSYTKELHGSQKWWQIFLDFSKEVTSTKEIYGLEIQLNRDVHVLWYSNKEERDKDHDRLHTLLEC